MRVRKTLLLASLSFLTSCGGGDPEPATGRSSEHSSALNAQATVIFHDSFSRPSGATLGMPDVGGAWTEGGELSTVSQGGPAKDNSAVHPANVALQDGAMAFSYESPFSQPNARVFHANPYAWASLSRQVSSATLSFSFTPASGYIQYAVGLVNTGQGLRQSDGSVPGDYGPYYPKDGIVVQFSQGEGASGPSIGAYKLQDGIIYGTNAAAPFALTPGVTYRFTVSLTPQGLSVSMSDGVSAFPVIDTTLGGRPVDFNGVFVHDWWQPTVNTAMGDPNIARFDDITVETTEVAVCANAPSLIPQALVSTGGLYSGVRSTPVVDLATNAATTRVTIAAERLNGFLGIGFAEGLPFFMTVAPSGTTGVSIMRVGPGFVAPSYPDSYDIAFCQAGTASFHLKLDFAAIERAVGYTVLTEVLGSIPGVGQVQAFIALARQGVPLFDSAMVHFQNAATAQSRVTQLRELAAGARDFGALSLPRNARQLLAFVQAAAEVGVDEQLSASLEVLSKIDSSVRLWRGLLSLEPVLKVIDVGLTIARFPLAYEVLMLRTGGNLAGPGPMVIEVAAH